MLGKKLNRQAKGSREALPRIVFCQKLHGSGLSPVSLNFESTGQLHFFSNRESRRFEPAKHVKRHTKRDTNPRNLTPFQRVSEIVSAPLIPANSPR
jgi:hypothetical protein